MSKKFDVNDPEFWRSINWDETGPVIKSDHSVAVARSNGLRKGDPKFKSNCSISMSEGNKNPNKRAKVAMAMSKTFATPWGIFPSIISFNTWIHSKIPTVELLGADKRKSMPHLYYIVEDGPGQTTYEKVFHTPWGMAPAVAHPAFTLGRLHARACAAGDTDALKNKYQGDWFKKMSRRDPDNYYIVTAEKREWFLAILPENTLPNEKKQVQTRQR